MGRIQGEINMLKESILAFIIIFFMTMSLCLSTNPTPNPHDYEKELMRIKEQQADMEVKRLADAYAHMSDSERTKGDAEAY